MGDDHDLRDAHVADVTRRIEEYRHYGSGGSDSRPHRPTTIALPLIYPIAILGFPPAEAQNLLMSTRRGII